jgi:hypothetical protein
MVEEKTRGIKFGFFTSMGIFGAPGGAHMDPNAFVFALNPRKTTMLGKRVCCPRDAAFHVGQLVICSDANVRDASQTAFVMRDTALLAAEIVAWVV